MASEQGGQIELIQFHDDQIACIEDRSGRGYVAIKRICENVGIKAQSQLEKLKACHWAGVTIIVAPDARGVDQEIACIPHDRVPMWMATINVGKVAPELREKIKRYQAEAADVLARHFMGNQQPSTSTTLELILQQQMIANARYDGSLALLTRETADIRQELETIKAEQLRFATQGRTVIYYVPNGYHRFGEWCGANGVPKLGPMQPEEIHKARELSTKRGVPVYRCEVRTKPAAYYFTHEILKEWAAGFRKRHPRFFYKTFPFASQA